MSQYAELADLVIYGLPVNSLGSLTTTQQTDALIAASSQIDSYLRGRYPMPLLAWGIEVTKACCVLAAFDLMNIRGYNPASGADRNLMDRADRITLWLRDVQKGAAHPDVTISPPESEKSQYTQPQVVSRSVVDLATGATGSCRGW